MRRGGRDDLVGRARPRGARAAPGRRRCSPPSEPGGRSGPPCGEPRNRARPGAPPDPTSVVRRGGPRSGRWQTVRMAAPARQPESDRAWLSSLIDPAWAGPTSLSQLAAERFHGLHVRTYAGSGDHRFRPAVVRLAETRPHDRERGPACASPARPPLSEPNGASSESLAIGEIDQTVFDCPRCSRPLAVGTRRCPGCRTRLMAGVPLPGVGLRRGRPGRRARRRWRRWRRVRSRPRCWPPPRRRRSSPPPRRRSRAAQPGSTARPLPSAVPGSRRLDRAGCPRSAARRSSRRRRSTIGSASPRRPSARPSPRPASTRRSSPRRSGRSPRTRSTASSSRARSRRGPAPRRWATTSASPTTASTTRRSRRSSSR